MKVLVAGGAGYIGTHTCVALAENGFEIVCADNFSNSKPLALARTRKVSGQDFEFIKADFCDPAQSDAVFEGRDIDAVIYFAAFKAVGESVEKPLKYYANNLIGLMNIIASMNKYGVRNFVFSSSATVYGDHNPMPAKEEYPISATNPYGMTKVMTEEILRDICKADPNFNAVMLRYFNPIGSHESGDIGEDSGDRPNNLLPLLLQVADGTRKELMVFGNDYDTHDGTGVRDYIHVMDLAEGHVAALRRFEENRGLEVFNLGTGVGYSVLDIIGAFERATGVKVPYRIVDRRPGDVAVCLADPTNANTVLGWKTKRTLDDMCVDAWRWQTKNPNGYVE